MCVKCEAAVLQFFPGVAESDIGNLLFGATSFPFGCPKDVVQQLREMRDLGITTLDEACACSAEELDRAMTEMRTKEARDAGA